MTQELKTAGRLARPVWLLVRMPGEDVRRKALGPIYTLERLRGMAEGINWASPDTHIHGYAVAVPDDCDEVPASGNFNFDMLGASTFEHQITATLWYDYDEGRWDQEKEWNADRWQDIGLLLEEFGIEYPGDTAPTP